MKKRKIQKICIYILFALFANDCKYAVAQANSFAYNDHSKTKHQRNKSNKTDTDKISLREGLSIVEKKFRVSFVYELNTLKNLGISKSELINVAGLSDAIELITKETNLKVKKVGDSVFAVYEQTVGTSNSPAITTSSNSLYRINQVTSSGETEETKAIAFAISGVVSDAETNKAIAGVSVFVKGTGVGVNTNNTGEYTVNSSENKLNSFKIEAASNCF